MKSKKIHDWQTKKLGEVCDIVNGSTPLRGKKEFWDHGNIAWFTIDDIREQGRTIKFTKQKITKKALGKTSVRLLPSGSVLLCCTASVGEYAITEIPLTTNQQFNGLTVKNKKILDPFFLFYFSSTLKDQLLGLSGKTTIDFIPISRLKEIEISFPSLSEQHRIVKILNDVFENINKAKENAEKNLQNAKELFESYLQSVFANPGKDWEEKRLGEILDIKRGGSPRPIQKYLTGDASGINWIKIGDTKNIDKYIFKTKQRIIPQGLRKSRLVKDGDFILSNSMSFGRPYIMKTTGAIHDGWLVLSAKNHNKINKDYLYNILGSPYVFNQFNKLAAGSTVRNLNISLVSSVNIPLPPISKQKSIVSKLDALSAETKKLEEIYKQKLSDLEELKKSVLKKAFSGKLKT